MIPRAPESNARVTSSRLPDVVRIIGVIPVYRAEITIADICSHPTGVCSVSINTKSQPASPHISTVCAPETITKQPTTVVWFARFSLNDLSVLMSDHVMLFIVVPDGYKKLIYGSSKC